MISDLFISIALIQEGLELSGALGRTLFLSEISPPLPFRSHTRAVPPALRQWYSLYTSTANTAGQDCVEPTFETIASEPFRTAGSESLRRNCEIIT